MGIQKLGEIKKLMHAIRRVKQRSEKELRQQQIDTTASFLLVCVSELFNNL